MPLHLFIYSLFNDASSLTLTIKRRMKEYVSDGLEMMWKEAVMA
jgi:hypothetical protein